MYACLGSMTPHHCDEQEPLLDNTPLHHHSFRQLVQKPQQHQQHQQQQQLRLPQLQMHTYHMRVGGVGTQEVSLT